MDPGHPQTVFTGNGATSGSSPGGEQTFALTEPSPRIVDPAALFLR
jgi:hypothetical protein